jgi:hypothetical protein
MNDVKDVNSVKDVNVCEGCEWCRHRGYVQHEPKMLPFTPLFAFTDVKDVNSVKDVKVGLFTRCLLQLLSLPVCPCRNCRRQEHASVAFPGVLPQAYRLDATSSQVSVDHRP